MSVAKIIEVTSSSKTSFEDAMKKGVARASKTIKGIRGAWVQDQKVDVENGKITAFRVTMKITFILE
jgi:dodecin